LYRQLGEERILAEALIDLLGTGRFKGNGAGRLPKGARRLPTQDLLGAD
jgi:hypothetical protein